MHKNLHKDLYSKRNKKKYYPSVNNISISPSDNVNYETEEDVTVIVKKKYNMLIDSIFSKNIILLFMIFFI